MVRREADIGSLKVGELSRQRGETEPLLVGGDSHIDSEQTDSEHNDSEHNDSHQTDSDILELPLVIRETVPLKDDPTINVVTFRYILLSTVFVIPGAFIDTMNSYRTTSAAYSIFFVQIVSHWCGKWLAKVLPNKEVRLGFVKFNLNPGPWSIKETALITITANSGATGNLATNALSLADLHFGETVNPVTAISFMLAIVFIGYAYAAIAKNLVLYDPQFPWPQALMQTTLLQSQAKADNDSQLGNKQMKVFFYVLSFVTVWQFLPEFAFPMVSSLAVLCWFQPYNKTINFIGSGVGGMGFLNLTLDWSNITSSIMLFPYWVQVIQFIAFVLCTWILIPLVKFTDIYPFKAGLMSNSIFLNNGTLYPTKELISPDYSLNTTAYEMYGPANLGAQRVWNVFFDYAAYISGIVWVILFGYDRLYESFTKLKSSKSGLNNTSLHAQYTDRLNKLQSKYVPVPDSWYIILFLISFTTLMMIFLSGQMFMPWWCCVIGLILGSIIVTPLSWLYALSNFQLPVGTFNELFYGYLVQGYNKIHPASGIVFGSIAGDAWYRAQYHLECMRLGFYIHLPPKAVFLAQIYGELIGVPVNYIALRWVLSSKREFLTGKAIDPLHQWTGQTIESIHTNAIQYVILGPSRLFSKYPILPYGFVLGLVAPMCLYWLHMKYPHRSFNYWNTTVFFSTASKFRGNLSTGPLSQFIGGTLSMFYGFRYKHDLWKKYNYLLAAAFDTGYNLAILAIFLFFSLFFNIQMPHWWGNNEKNIERCFAL